MSENKVSLKGLDDILKLLTSWLKTPEERELFAAQAEKEFSEADKIKIQATPPALKEIAKIRSLEIKNLEQAVELYQNLGYSEEEIRELVGPKLEKLLETHDDLLVLKQLANNGVIVHSKVKQIEPPSSKDTD